MEKQDTFENIKSFKTQWNVCASNNGISGSSSPSSNSHLSNSQPNTFESPSDQGNTNFLPNTLTELQSRMASLTSPEARFSLLSAYTQESGVLECDSSDPTALRACIERSSLTNIFSADLPTRLLIEVIECLCRVLVLSTSSSSREIEGNETNDSNKSNPQVVDSESPARCAIGVLLLLSGAKRFRLTLQFLNSQQKQSLKELFQLLAVSSSTSSKFLFEEARQLYSSVLSK